MLGHFQQGLWLNSHLVEVNAVLALRFKQITTKFVKCMYVMNV